jgi:tetratricopeptide (TPR) repeat protein
VTQENQMAVKTRSAGSGGAAPDDSGRSFPSLQKAVFRKAGWHWTVGLEGREVRLKETRGLSYVAHLLRHPDVEFHVLDLYGGIVSQHQHEEDESNQALHALPRGNQNLQREGTHIAGLGDAGAMLDQQAKVAYRRRISELRKALEEAKALGKVECAEKAEQEIGSLTRELSRAVGLGGRTRRAASVSERARQTVTHSIKSALERIVQRDATFGALLVRCIKTGTFCSYLPDSDFPVAWEFAETVSEQEEHPAASGDSARTDDDDRQIPHIVSDISRCSFPERTTFVGRETEIRAIHATIDCALSGRGSIVILSGEAGVGKSRLAIEMAAHASRLGFKCLLGHCYERDEPFPYLPFVEIIESGLAQTESLQAFRQRMGDKAAELARLAPRLRRVFPDIPTPLELAPAQQRRFLFQSVSDALAYAARTQSYLFVLEDLQWADESTLALLAHFTSRISELPVVIIGICRDLHSENNPALTRTLEELIRQGVRPLKLAALSKDTVAKMLLGLAKREVPESLVNLVFDQTEGNPFFVEELYRHMLEDGRLCDAAGQFRSDIDVEASGVPENVRLVIGRRLERLSESEKLVLAAAAVIGRSFSFQLLAAITQIDVDELFTVIEKAQRTGIIVSSAEGPERPFTFGHELTRQTLLASISAPRQERLHADVADAIERLYPGTVNERISDITDHLLKAGSFADPRRLIRCLTLAGKSALNSGAFEEARRSFRSALFRLGEVDAKERADLLADLAIAERGLEHWDRAFVNLAEALEIYISLGDQQMIAKSCIELPAVLGWADRSAEAPETAERRLAYIHEAASDDRARLLAILDHARAANGSFEPANEALREALGVVLELSDPARAWIEFGKTGDLAKLKTSVQTVLKSESKLSSTFWNCFSEVQLSLIDFLRGNWASALLHAQASSETGAETLLREFGIGTLFRQLAYAGNHEGALAILDQERDFLPRMGQPNTRARWWMLAQVIEGLAMLGEQSRVGQLYPVVRGLVRSGSVALWPLCRFTQTVAGIAAAAAQQWESAEEHFQSAQRQAEAVPHQLEQAEICRFKATMLIDRAARGDRGKARGLLREAEKTYTHIGMPRHVEITQSLLRQAAGQ